MDAWLARRELAHWTRLARDAARTEMSSLRRHRNRARELKTQLDSLIHTADSRLALPAIGSDSFFVPHDADWSWRPELWRGPLPQRGVASIRSKVMFGNEITLFHDCHQSEVTLRQLRNERESDLAPFGLRMDVFSFDGTFLSLVLDLPAEAAAGLKRRHLIRVETTVDLEMPIDIFARLNIRHGPNTEQLVRKLPLDDKEVVVEFDLAYSNLNEKRIEKIWIDLIFDEPAMNQIVLRDLTFSRSPRADL